MPCPSPSPSAATTHTASHPPALMQALGHSLSDRRLQVLHALGECGSISQAARQVGVSYKAAWQAIDTLSNLAGVPVVQKSVGGAGGGGTRLTPAGQELLRAAHALTEARSAVIQQLQAMPVAPVQAAQRLAVQTSMRNQWPCYVQQVRISGAFAQVDLQLHTQHGDAENTQLTASITAESAQLLGLQKGLHILALCKATALQMHTTRADVDTPTNLWPVKALRVNTGTLGDEIAAQTSSGLQVVGLACARSGVGVGRKLWAYVPASAVVLALI